MIVVDTVLPADGASVVVVRFSIVVVEVWAKAGALNTNRAPAATNRRLILIPPYLAPASMRAHSCCQQDEASDHSRFGRVEV